MLPRTMSSGLRIVLSAFLAVSMLGVIATAIQPPASSGFLADLDSGHTRYSSLTEITTGNVSRLKPVWVYDTGSEGRGWQVSPLVVGEVMYLSVPGGAAAIDSNTGTQIWKFKPSGLSRPGRDRGVAYWPGRGTLAPRVIYTVADRMYALDAKTGLPVEAFGNKGMVNLRDDVADKYPNAQYAINSPAGIYKDLAIVAPSTQEFGSKGPSGDPRAFDIVTGKQVWRFHTVPQPGEPHADSWGPDGWVDRAGPSAWAGVTVDATTGLVFIPVGNPDDSFNGIDRPGNNDYANSIVALDASTGKMRWFYQMTHHDINDLDAASAPSLIDIHRDGKVIPALVEVPKSGLAFVLDRRTGKPVFGDEERPVPKSDVPGEQSSPTQPFPLKPFPLLRTTISRDDITTMSPEAHDFCLAQWDKLQMHNSGPYTPVSVKGTTVFMPGTSGGGNWGGVSTDPRRGYFFVNVSNRPTTSRMVADGAGGYKLEGAYSAFSDDKGWPCINPPWGELVAVSVNSGEIMWRSPLGSADVYGARGKTSGTTTLGGSIATAGGLIFIGATLDSEFRAFDAATGKEVWSTPLPSPAMATPVVYRGKSGREFVAIAAGGPGTVQVPGHFASYKQVLIAYALPAPGDASVNLAQFEPTEMPQRRSPAARQNPTTGQLPPTLTVGPPELPDGVGKQEFLTMCGPCHGVNTALSARRSPQGWRDLIQDMRSRGAQGDDATANRVNEYLSHNFGVMP